VNTTETELKENDKRWIDTGTHTGMAVWDNRNRCFLSIDEYQIHTAMEKCMELKRESGGGWS